MKVNYEDGNRHLIGKKIIEIKAQINLTLVCIDTTEFSKTETISKAVITLLVVMPGVARASNKARCCPGFLANFLNSG